MGVDAGAGAPSEPLSSELLGFPAEARVVIINCDDLGLHESVNTGVLEAVREGVASSCSLMALPGSSTGDAPAAPGARGAFRHPPDPEP